MNLPRKWAYNPLFADKLAKFADEMLLYGEKPFVFETQFFPGEVPHPLASGYSPGSKFRLITRGL